MGDLKRHGNSATSSSDVLGPLPLQKYPSIGSLGPYRDPGIGGTTLASALSHMEKGLVHTVYACVRISKTVKQFSFWHDYVHTVPYTECAHEVKSKSAYMKAAC